MLRFFLAIWMGLGPAGVLAGELSGQVDLNPAKQRRSVQRYVGNTSELWPPAPFLGVVYLTRCRSDFSRFGICGILSD